MQTKRIKCPKCGVVLDVKNSKNETEKQITCPQCKSPLKVTFPPEQEPLEAETYYAPPKQPTDHGATQLGAGFSGATQLVTVAPKTSTSAKLMFGGAIYPLEEGQNIVGRKGTTSRATVQIETADRYMSLYPLEEGQNIVGRKGTTSRATVQIETADRYMSRQHCSITVSTLPDGTKKAVLSNYQNKNLTSVDGQEIETGDAIRLTNGNAITMGHTTVTFKLI